MISSLKSTSYYKTIEKNAQFVFIISEKDAELSFHVHTSPVPPHSREELVLDGHPHSSQTIPPESTE